MRKLAFPDGRGVWLPLGQALLRAYAGELALRKLGIRLRVVAFGGVRQSAAALKAGKADLAVVQPDVAMSKTRGVLGAFPIPETL